MGVRDEIAVLVQDETEHMDVLVDRIHRSQGTVAVIVIARIRAGVALGWMNLSIGCNTAEGHRAHTAGVLEGQAVVVHKVRMHLQAVLAGRPKVAVVIEGPAIAKMPGIEGRVACAVCTQVVQETKRAAPSNGDSTVMAADQGCTEAAPSRGAEGARGAVGSDRADFRAVLEQVPCVA